MTRQNQQITIETRGCAVVGSFQGSAHSFYEDRYRLLVRDIEVVEAAGRGEIVGVFDGMGSLPQGMRAAQPVADRLIEFFEKPDEHEPTNWTIILPAVSTKKIEYLLRKEVTRVN